MPPKFLRYRSPWWGYAIAAYVLLAVCLAVGLTQQHSELMVASSVCLPLPSAMVLRALGPVRSMRFSAGACELTGGVGRRTVRLSNYAFVQCYRMPPRTFHIEGGVLVALYRNEGRHPLGKLLNETLPRVSLRRTTIVILTGWREPDVGPVHNTVMEACLRQACRAAGMVIEEHHNEYFSRKWTATRPRRRRDSHHTRPAAHPDPEGAPAPHPNRAPALQPGLASQPDPDPDSAPTARAINM
ncbi:hypothetical protein B7R22_05850 [Subtercola boreus]|uniref:Uncharacterized protein n=1 Tax=Subtercola boreus TaxID=120213 RepID=A0A3E0W187_9MICO|nr:hypothetical protein [Subtercola boreus]RFA15916.1 hypothetical protein B7R22_05850 [Subtercola boreus]